MVTAWKDGGRQEGGGTTAAVMEPPREGVPAQAPGATKASASGDMVDMSVLLAMAAKVAAAPADATTTTVSSAGLGTATTTAANTEAEAATGTVADTKTGAAAWTAPAMEPIPDLPPLDDAEWEAWAQTAAGGGVAAPLFPPEEVAPPWRDFPVKCLPPSVRDYVKSVARSVGCDPAMTAVPLLSALAAAIGNAREFRPAPSWREPSILWTAFVADSGIKKSPALDAAMDFLRDHDKTDYEQYQRDLVRYASEADAYEAARKSRKPSTSGPGDAPVPEKPVEPVCPTVLVNDATAEALVEKLEQCPRGLLSEHDELCGVFKALDAYRGGRGGDAEKMLSFHRAQQVRVDRKTGRKTILVSRASVGFTGGVQPMILRKLLKANHGEYADNGMLARFLLAMPPARPLSLENPAIDADARERMAVIFRELLALMPPVAPGEAPPTPVIVTIDADARAIHNHFRQRLDAALATLDAGDPIRHIFPKLESYVVRLAGVLHLVRWKDPANVRSVDPAMIDATGMMAGTLLAGWFLNEARRVYAWFSQTDATDAKPEDPTPKINAWINQRGGRVRVRDLNKKFCRAMGWSNIEECVTWLAGAYLADGMATLVREGRSRVLVLADVPEPQPERPEDEEDEYVEAAVSALPRDLADPIPF